MSEQTIGKTSLDELMESLEQHEAERALESLRTGNPFDAGVVEGISNAIDKLDSARTSSDLASFVSSLAQTEVEDNDPYTQGIVAGASHVAEVVRDELASAPDREF